MIPERWSVVKDKLYAALELEGSRRAAYLDEIAQHDPELRRELDSLLASHEQASAAFLNLPAAEITTLFPASDDMIGRRLGPYQVINQIGIGGMGEVYRAFRADDEYRKEVAIKLVRAGQASGLILVALRMSVRFWPRWSTQISAACWMEAPRPTDCPTW